MYRFRALYSRGGGLNRGPLQALVEDRLDLFEGHVVQFFLAEDAPWGHS